MEKYYSIHDIVTFKVVTNAGFLSKILYFWDVELRDFESEQKDKPDFTVFLGRFSSQNSDCHILDDRFYVKKDYLYCRDSYRYANWELEISGFESGNMEVRLSANAFGWISIPELIIYPIIWFKLNEKGYTAVHSSGVAKDSRAYVFAGQGAAGKTTIALKLLERGFRLLGDHFIILNNATALSFLSPLHLMNFNLTPFVRERMKTNHKILFGFNQLLGRMTGKGIGTKISSKTLFPGLIENKVKLHSVFLLLPRQEFKVERINKKEFIAHMLANQKLESFPFIKYMMEYSYLFPKSKMASYWVQYEKNLRQALDSVKVCCRVEVPLKYNDETLVRISELVSKC